MLRLTPPPSRPHALHSCPVHSPSSPTPTQLLPSLNPQPLPSFILSSDSFLASSSVHSPPSLQSQPLASAHITHIHFHPVSQPPLIFTQPTAFHSSSSARISYSFSRSRQSFYTLTRPTAPTHLHTAHSPPSPSRTPQPYMPSSSPQSSSSLLSARSPYSSLHIPQPSSTPVSAPIPSQIQPSSTTPPQLRS